MKASRLLNKPIIYSHMDQRIGTNINGPSVIRVPEWVKNPLGCYYLYFAHHKGKFIRLAYADEISGPWKIYTNGVLDLEDSFFELQDDHINPEYYAHIASPDVHVDSQQQRLYMYFHGMLTTKDQQTRIAFSTDGLLFHAKLDVLGPPYFRVFQYKDFYYALSWGGDVLRSRTVDGPFERGHRLQGITTQDRPNRILRHCAVLVRGHKLHLFYSCIDDSPEHIVYSKINLEDHWLDWRVKKIKSVLKPEMKWEGVNLPIIKSQIGATQRCHQLRDPCLFKDKSNLYLFYCGAGESGIGVANLAL